MSNRILLVELIVDGVQMNRTFSISIPKQFFKYQYSFGLKPLCVFHVAW